MPGDLTSRSVLDTGRDTEHALKLLLAEAQRTNQLLEALLIAQGVLVPEPIEAEFKKRKRGVFG